MGGGRLIGVGCLIEVCVPGISFHYRVINLAKFLGKHGVKDNHDRGHSRRPRGS